MNVVFYKNKSDTNVVRKSLTSLVQYEHVVLKEEGGIDDFSIIIKDDWARIEDINYAYIPELSRYYFVSQPIMRSGGRTEYPLTIDPLMSLKDQLLATEQLIGRQEFIQSRYQSDSAMPTSVRKNVEVAQFTKGIFNTSSATADSYNFVLTCAGNN